MKYNINNNSIDIEYIANGKRNQLKLNNDDAVDMDFFNQLMKANSNKRDAMCDLFKRKILKEDDEDTIHIQPLKLDKELKPSKYAEKVELQRRKAELEQDKQHIAEEAKVLLKDEAKKKDITTLTKDDLNNENDLNKLKEIQARYIEIDKVHKMIINQLDSLEIGSADQVNIKELKNLTVNAFDTINKKLIETKLSEQDKQELQNKIAPVMVPDFKPLQDSIAKLLQQIEKIPKKASAKKEVVSKDYSQELGEIKNSLSTIIDSLPKTETVNELKETLKNISTIPQNTSIMAKQLSILPALLYNLQIVIQEQLSQAFSSINFQNYETAINKLSQRIASLEEKASVKKDDDSKDYTSKFEEILSQFGIIKQEILTAIEKLPQSEEMKKLKDELSKIELNTDDIPQMKDSLKEIKTTLGDLPGVFKKETIDEVTKTINELISSKGDGIMKEILNRPIIIDNLITQIKQLPEINPTSNFTEFKAKLFADANNHRLKNSALTFEPESLFQLPNIAFRWDDFLYLKTQRSLPLHYTVEEFFGLYYHKYKITDIQNTKVKDWIEFLVPFFDDESITIFSNPPFAIGLTIGISRFTASGNKNVWYPAILFSEAKNYVTLIKTISGIKDKPSESSDYSEDSSESSSSDSGEGILNKCSGEIKIDLDKSTLEEKLNEIIRILSQMNYYVFTTTPLNKNTKLQKKQSEKAKGIDLYDILDL